MMKLTFDDSIVIWHPVNRSFVTEASDINYNGNVREHEKIQIGNLLDSRTLDFFYDRTDRDNDNDITRWVYSGRGEALGKNLIIYND